MKFNDQLLKRLAPYVAGEYDPNIKIKLNTNENPYDADKNLLKQIKSECKNLKIYSDPDVKSMIKSASKYYNVKEENVFIGNGSDEVLALSFMALFNKEKPILLTDITYSFYPVFAKLCGLKVKIIKLDKDLQYDLKKYYKSQGGLILTNPNAPTGEYLNIKDIESILENNKDVPVIIDEAYIDFSDDISAVTLINKYKNLLVVQTMSKSFSLAGLRVGMAIADKKIIEAINKVRNSFNAYTIDALGLKGGTYAFEHPEYMTKNVRKIIKTRENFIKQFEELGFKVLPSKTNFIFVTKKDVNAKALMERLKEKGILIRHFNNPRIKDYLRITIGKDKDMNILIKEIKSQINGVSHKTN